MSLFNRGTRRDGDVEERIQAVLAELRPMLRLDAAAIELVEFDHERGVALLRFAGDCPDCEMSVGMLREGIEAHLRMHVPEVREVRADDGMRR